MPGTSRGMAEPSSPVWHGRRREARGLSWDRVDGVEAALSRDDAIFMNAPRRPRRGPNGLKLDRETTPDLAGRRDRTARLQELLREVVEALVVRRPARPADAPHETKIEELLDEPLQQVRFLSIGLERHFGFGPE